MSSILEKKSKFSLNNSQFLGVITLLFIIGLVSSTLLSLLSLVFLAKLTTKPPVNLVQLSTGESFTKYSVLGFKERSNESIKNFVLNIISLSFTWTGIIPSELNNGGPLLKDEGVNVTVNFQNKDNKKNSVSMRIPTTTWAASFGFDLNFRDKFLVSLERYIPRSVFNLKSQVVFVPVHIDNPVPIGKDKWRLRLIGNIIYRSESFEDKIPYNKEIIVRAVDYQSPLGFEDISSEYLLGVINKIRQNRLEIIQIEDIVSK